MRVWLQTLSCAPLRNNKRFPPALQAPLRQPLHVRLAQAIDAARWVHLHLCAEAQRRRSGARAPRGARALARRRQPSRAGRQAAIRYGRRHRFLRQASLRGSDLRRNSPGGTLSQTLVAQIVAQRACLLSGMKASASASAAGGGAGVTPRRIGRHEPRQRPGPRAPVAGASQARPLPAAGKATGCVLAASAAATPSAKNEAAHWLADAAQLATAADRQRGGLHAPLKRHLQKAKAGEARSVNGRRCSAQRAQTQASCMALPPPDGLAFVSYSTIQSDTQHIVPDRGTPSR
jgi:hypothetical protein